MGHQTLKGAMYDPDHFARQLEKDGVVPEEAERILQTLKGAMYDPDHFARQLEKDGVVPEEAQRISQSMIDGKGMNLWTAIVFGSAVVVRAEALITITSSAVVRLYRALKIYLAVHVNGLSEMMLEKLLATGGRQIIAILSALPSAVSLARCIAVSALVKEQQEMLEEKLARWENDWLRGAQLPAEGATDASTATALDDLNSIHKEVEQCVKKARVAARHAKVGMAVGILGAGVGVGVLTYGFWSAAGVAGDAAIASVLGETTMLVAESAVVVGTICAIGCGYAYRVSEKELDKLAQLQVKLEFILVKCRQPTLTLGIFLVQNKEIPLHRIGKYDASRDRQRRAFAALQKEAAVEHAKCVADSHRWAKQKQLQDQQDHDKFEADVGLTELASVAAFTKEQQQQALAWVKKEQVKSIREIVEYDLVENFLEHLQLAKVPKYKTEAHLNEQFKK